jgi:hypothetical protein
MRDVSPYAIFESRGLVTFHHGKVVTFTTVRCAGSGRAPEASRVIIPRRETFSTAIQPPYSNY